MQLVMNVASDSTVMTEVSAFLVTGQIYGEQAAAHGELHTAQFEDAGPILHRLRREALKSFFVV
jgi:hypothetical protein